MTATVAAFGANAVVPCPSDSARRRHAALGQECRACEPTVAINLSATGRQEVAA